MGKRIPQNKIDEIYAIADIVEVVGDYLELKKRGTNYFALSPFSNEKTPSFAVSPSKNIFKDFSSGKGGNAVTFLMDVEGMSYVEALKHLAEKYNIDLELEETEEDTISKDKRESLYVLNNFAANYFHQQLMEDETGRRIGLSYFKERGILETTIKEFELGYSPAKWDAFASTALKNQFEEEYLLETGLCFKSDKDGSLLDRYRGRVMFPIHNHLGKVVGFGGRILDKTKKAAKYVNSPESEIYHKSRVLYGLYQGRQAIRDQDFTILVEGYMDVIALWQSGIRNVVASSGTALTEDQVRLMKRFSKKVLLIYDADPAGISAALRGADLLLEQELDVRVLLLPEGHDPDSFVNEHGKSGFDAYREEHATDFIGFKISHLFSEQDANDPAVKSRIIHDVAGTIARIPDSVKQAVYISSAAKQIGIAPEVIKTALNQAVNKKQQQEARQERFKAQREDRTVVQTPKEKIPEIKESSISADQEKEILRLILNYSDRILALDENEIPLVSFFIEELEDIPFTNDSREYLKNTLFDDYQKYGRLNIHQYLHHENEKIAKLVGELITIPYEVSENWEKFEIRAPKIDEDIEFAATNTTLHYKRRQLFNLLQEGRKALKGKAIDDEYIRRYIALEKMRTDLAKIIGTEGAIDPTIIDQSEID